MYCTIERISVGYYSVSCPYGAAAGHHNETKPTDDYKRYSDPHQGGDNEGKLVGGLVAVQTSRCVVGRIYRINPGRTYRETFSEYLRL